MKTYLNLSIIFLLLTSCVLSDVESEAQQIIVDIENMFEETATYQLSFVFDWNSTDFPNEYPSSAHFSPLVGWVHEKDHPYFKEGEFASSGIEQMAETGSTTTLENELEALISQNIGLKTYTGSGLSGGVGTISIEIEVNREFPAVSFASMLAPSPDWFVACASVNLLDEDNEFVLEKTLVGHLYDAGTEEGNTFSYNNEETQPQNPITRITEPPMGDGTEVKPSLCTVIFTKQ
ncbi:MAG: spondin domain-containing protein [Flavobacteriaceae bacterium]|nr:spondin domain-containing protein [Flavobacteriaceae bacterium]